MGTPDTTFSGGHTPPSVADALCERLKRPRVSIAGLFVMLVAVELLLVTLHCIVATQFAHIAAATADGHIGVFDLDDEANLAAWFSSIQLLVIGLVCLLTRAAFNARRITGGFWGLASFAFIFMSIDETSGLHELFGQFMAHALPQIPISASMWWSIPYALLLGTVLLFICIRVMRAPATLVLIVLGGGCWFMTNILEHIAFFPVWANVAMEEGLEMLGASLLLVGLLRHLRACPSARPRAA